MRVFHCDHCSNVVAFSAHRCHACGAELGYVDGQQTVRALTPTTEATSYSITGHEPVVWRCLNSAWGCNWVVPADGGTTWCRSCQLTRGRPDHEHPQSIEAWMTAESAKRRLVHQLDELGLPIDIRSSAAPDGLTFDLVHLPGQGGVTGHLDGVVTLDLAEADDHHREELRRRLGEPFRTVIGHLRHEIGHHYWERLVGQTDELVRFRRLFGDERSDYARAIDEHYADHDGASDPGRFLTAYAAAHPLEDWAESFAHYLHIVDALDTAIAHELTAPVTNQMADLDTNDALGFVDLLEAWRPINTAVNAIAETLGVAAVYPFEPAGAVIDKLAFVHHQITTHTQGVGQLSRSVHDHDDRCP